LWVSLSSDTAADSRERQHGPSAKGWKYAVTGEKSEIMVREPWMNHGKIIKHVFFFTWGNMRIYREERIKRGAHGYM
jgi:hypothetical protein